MRFFLFLLVFLNLSLKTTTEECQYEIQKSETLFSIAQHFVIKTEALTKFNKIEDASKVRAGLKIKIPCENYHKYKNKEKPKRETASIKIEEKDTKIKQIQTQGPLTQVQINEKQVNQNKINQVPVKNEKAKEQNEEVKKIQIETPIFMDKNENEKVKIESNNICSFCSFDTFPIKDSRIKDTFGKNDNQHASGIEFIPKSFEDLNITSVSNGKVIYIGDSVSINKEEMIIVSNKDCFFAYSGNFKNKKFVKEGDKVRKGQIIATLNNCSDDSLDCNSKLPRLFFAVKIDHEGINCNPLLNFKNNQK